MKDIIRAGKYDIAISGKSIRLESCRFQREEKSVMEAGILINEGDGMIMDMDGKLVDKVYRWIPFYVFAISFQDN